MFLDGLKHNLVKTKVNNWLTQPTTHKEVGRIANVVILVEARFVNEGKNLLKRLDKLTQSSENKLVVFAEKRADQSAEDLLYMSKTDFSLFGNLKNEAVKNLIEQPFGLLISYYTSENVFLNFVATQSKAAFKVGIDHKNTAINALTIQVEPTDVAAFETELVKYLKLLKRIE